jgi:hypothetical protein
MAFIDGYSKDCILGFHKNIRLQGWNIHIAITVISLCFLLNGKKLYYIFQGIVLFINIAAEAGLRTGKFPYSKQNMELFYENPVQIANSHKHAFHGRWMWN